MTTSRPPRALAVSGLFEGFAWSLLTVLGIGVAVAGNVLMLRPKRAPAST